MTCRENIVALSWMPFLATFVLTSTFAQERERTQLNPLDEKGTTYLSAADESLTVRKIAVLPTVDNVDGIYARSFEAALVKSIEEDHKWDLVDSKTVGPLSSPQDLEDNPNLTITLGKSIGCDAIFASRVTKGPEGLTLRLSLFLSNDGKLFLNEELTRLQNFDTKNIQARAIEMITNIRRRMPYQAFVLSRTGQRVTISYGLRDGVKKDQLISAIQIIKINRHPKFNFFVNAEKEILGKIKIRKVEDALSFGDIVTEKEVGVISKNTKLSGSEFVEYSELPVQGESEKQHLNKDEPSTKIAFGENPSEWRPVRPASFGLINLALGIGSYSHNGKPAGSSQTYSATKPYYLNLKIHGELWMNPNWQMEVLLRQGIMTVNNPRADSQPSEINISTSTYALYFVYNWLIRDDFSGPKLSALLGFKQYSSTADNSTPVAFSTMVYRGLDFGLRGTLPLDTEQLWRAGATFNITIMPAMEEKPLTSGESPSNSVNVFSVFASKKIGQRLEATGQLELEYYSTTFAGSGTSASQRITTLYGGVSYLF